MSFVVPSVGSGSSPGPAATATTTLDDIVRQTWRHLYSGVRVIRTKLSSTITSSTTNLAFDYSRPAAKEGAKVSIDFEDMIAWSGANVSAVVERGQMGSTAVTHSGGSIAYLNAPFSQWDIYRAINDELLHLSSPSAGLFRMNFTDITYSPAVQGYDLGVGDLIDIWEIRAETIGPDLDWPLLTHWSLARSQDTTDFASGNSLLLYEGAYPGKAVRVFYRTGFTQFTDVDPTANVEDATGLYGQAHDILALGAALRLAGAGEVARNLTDSQGDTRRAGEVPPGAKNASVGGLLREYTLRLNAESMRLSNRYPTRFKRRR